MDSIAEYEKLSGRKISPRKSLLYKRIYEIDDLSEHLDDPESDIYKKAIERIHRWMKEKDIYR